MKIKLLLLCILSSLLCSCSLTGYSEPEDRYIVSAIGFDYADGIIETSVQIVDGEKFTIRSGRGESVRQAMGHIEGADAKQLEISHCALIVIGDSVGKDDLSDIFEYCRQNGEITVGVKVASAHNAKEMLSFADGYELLGAIRDNKDGVGFTRGSRFYEIEEIRESGEGQVYHLPYFEKDGEIYTVSGLKIYRKDSGIVRLDRSESVYYMMIKGELSGGVADFGGDSIYIEGCKTKLSDGRLICTLSVSDCGDKIETEMALSSAAQSLLSDLTERYGDIFAFGKNEILVECKLSEGR